MVTAITDGTAGTHGAKVDSPGKGWWSRLAVKAGKPPRGRSLGETNLLHNAASSTVELLRACEDDPNLAIHLAQTAKKKDMVMFTKAAESDCWPGYTRVKRLPKYWLAQYLIMISDGRVQKHHMNKLEEKCPTAVKTIVHWTHQINDNTEMTQEMQHKACCSYALQARHDEMGRRLMHILDRPEVWNLDTGDFDIQALSSYDLLCVGAKITKVRHVGSGEVKDLNPEDIVGDFEVHNHLVDCEAFIKGARGRRLMFCELWDEGAGPWKTHGSVKEMQLSYFASAYAQKQAEAQKNSFQVVADAPNTLAEAQAKKQADILEVARQKLVEKRNQEKVRRVIKVKMPAPPAYEQPA